MLGLKITKASGEESTHEISPAIEYAAEQYWKTGFHKRFRDEERQSDIYWLAWECLRRSGETVKPFGDAFLETIAKVEILDADSPNG
jgi:hypothetical protein